MTQFSLLPDPPEPAVQGSRNGIGAHQSAAASTVEWLTPPWVLEALGGADQFDLDPCAPEVRPWPTARRHYTKRDNGLVLPWDGRVWLNPPYTAAEIAKWLGRMAEHDCGTALIFARTETEAFFAHVWERASAVLFIKGRCISTSAVIVSSRARATMCSVVVPRPIAAVPRC